MDKDINTVRPLLMKLQREKDQYTRYNATKTLLGRAEASPTLITHTRKSLYLCMYVCMYVSVYVAIRRPRAHHAIAHVRA